MSFRDTIIKYDRGCLAPLGRILLITAAGISFFSGNYDLTCIYLLVYLVLKPEENKMICKKYQKNDIDCNYCDHKSHCIDQFKVYSGSVDIFRTKTELIITGDPDEMLVEGSPISEQSDNHPHNCDEMGCSSAFHVIFRIKIEEIKK